MRIFWLIIYNVFFVPLMWAFFNIYALFNSKVKQGIDGRRGLFEILNKSLPFFTNGKKNVLIHSSSLGEYQQAIPLIEQLIKKDYNITVSFFSPSGYEHSRLLHEDIVKIYLPLDSYSRSRRLLDMIRPDLIIFMRYDLWYNLLYHTRKKGIRTILANARYDENDITWKIPIVSSFKKALYNMVDKIFVIDDEDFINYAGKLNTHKTHLVKSGDSKYERVIQASQNIIDRNIIDENIIADKKIFVMGSSWKDDEDIVLPVLNKIAADQKDLLIFLVPHEPKEKKIILIEQNLIEEFKELKAIRYSQLERYNGENLIIVDRMGILMNLYSLAYASYVGGGFRSGLHNILEPAVFNMPIFFSNRVKNSDEDEKLIESGCAILVTNEEQLYKDLNKVFTDEAYRNELGSKCREVFESSLGTADRIIENLTR